MEETVIVIMIKDKQTGFLEKELSICPIYKNDSLILNCFAQETEEGLFVFLRLSCDREVLDWEFNAIFDYYDTQKYDDLLINGVKVSCEEFTDCFNPTWEFSFLYNEDLIEKTINLLIEEHLKELKEVYEIIVGKKESYE